MNIIAVLILGLGTYAFRVAGPLLRERVELSERVKDVLTTAALVLLVSLVVTASLMSGQRFAGIALPVGVAIGGVLAWRKAPFIVVVIAAAVTTAGLRLLGVP
jgi:branched-subunit amino acid transport protein